MREYVAQRVSQNVAALCVAAGAVAGCGMTQTASAQTAPLMSEPVQIGTDSGFVANNNEPGFSVVYSTVVSQPGATWLRLYFGDVALSGNKYDTNKRSYLRITSMADGAVHLLDARSIEDWNSSSAYMNGDSVVVELLAAPGTGLNRVVIDTADAGVHIPDESICGSVDDRQLSNDPRNARLLPPGCTVWLIDDAAKCFITAGHCISNGSSSNVAQFNVPLSNSNGSLNHPGPDDQYPVDSVSIQSNGGAGVGNDYAYLGFKINSNTGLTAFEAQGDAYHVSTTMPPVSGTDIRITGYGTVSSPVSGTFNQAQKTHVGPMAISSTSTLGYVTDTSGGNSGSPVINENTGDAIGVHTHGGCNSSGQNHGTSAARSGFVNFRNNPKGVCIPQGLAFSYPSGLPTTFDANGGDTITMLVQANGGNVPQQNTGEFHYDDGSGIVTINMTQTSPNNYTVTLPGAQCGTIRDFFFSADATSGTTFTDPEDAPAQTYAATSIAYADCSGNGTLNIFDYICFGDDFAAGGTYADCDGSGSLNILDYICFGDAFAAGCP